MKKDNVPIDFYPADYPNSFSYGGGIPISTGLGEPSGAITQYVFNTDDQILLYVYHLLKGHRLEVERSPEGKERVIWITEEKDPTIKPLVTPRGLHFVMGFIRSNLSNISIISTLNKSLIANRYADIRDDLAKELYVNYDIYFPTFQEGDDYTQSQERLASAYHTSLKVVSDVLFYLLVGIENGRILEQITKRVEEMHQFEHQPVQSGFLGLKRRGGL